MYRSVAVADGQVVVRGPSGYCVEGRSLRNSNQDAFALLARCDILSKGREGRSVALAMLTVTVTPYTGGEDLRPARELAKGFPQGAVAEARDISSVRLLHLRSGGDARLASADPRHWRAAFVLNDHLVLIAAYGPEGSNVAGAGGQTLVLNTARAMRAASPSDG